MAMMVMRMSKRVREGLNVTLLGDGAGMEVLGGGGRTDWRQPSLALSFALKRSLPRHTDVDIDTMSL